MFGKRSQFSPVLHYSVMLFTLYSLLHCCTHWYISMLTALSVSLTLSTRVALLGVSLLQFILLIVCPLNCFVVWSAAAGLASYSRPCLCTACWPSYLHLQFYSAFYVMLCYYLWLRAPAARCKLVHLHPLGLLTFNNLLNQAIKNLQKKK